MITAGQQARSLITLQANLTNRDAMRMPHPLVKWSYEPPRAQDVPAALARACHAGDLPPKGPVFVSIPMDDWEAEVDEDDARPAIAGRPAGARWPTRRRSPSWPGASRPPPTRCSSPAPTSTQRRLGRGGRAGRAPAPPGVGDPGARRRAPRLPGGPPELPGDPPAGDRPCPETLAGHDLVLVAGGSVFPYYPYIPGPLLPEGASLVAITNDPDEAARAPMGDAIVADVRLTLEALVEAVGDSDREPPPSAARAGGGPEESDPITGTAAMNAPGRGLPRGRDHRARVALGDPGPAQPAADLAARQLLLRRRRRAGFGLSAAVGVQLAQPDRPVVCVIGEGSVQYAVTALWSAVAYDVPVTFLVLRNDEYAILKWFADIEGSRARRGSTCPGLDTAAIATGYGVGSARVQSADELREALGEAIASGRARAGRGQGGARGCGCSDRGKRRGPAQRRRGARRAPGRGAGRRSRCAPT